MSDQPELRQDESGARVIVREALNRLREREAKVKPIHERVSTELDEVSQFVKVFEKALGATRPRTQPAAGRDPRPAPTSPRAAFLRKVVALLGDGGRTCQSIADHFGGSIDWTRVTVNKAVERGELRCDEHGVYTVPEELREP